MARANREDVAKLAGVSTAVVSYVINDGPRPVAEATRSRVVAAIEQLNYRPSATARALSLSRTYVLGLLMADITNPYFSEFARAFQDLAHEAGYAVMIGNTSYNAAKEDAELESFVGRDVDGIAVFAQRAETLDYLARWGGRTVTMDWQVAREDLPSVSVDGYGATRDAIEHLLWHGHERIGLVGGVNDPTMRNEAWRDTMEPVIGDAVLGLAELGEFTRDGGYHAGMRLLNRPDRPTAVFVSSDVQAFGVLRAAQVLGLNLPRDLAVVSIDGTTASAFTNPPLTAIQVPLDLVARQVLRKLTEPLETFELHTTVPHHLEVRSSCGCGVVE